MIAYDRKFVVLLDITREVNVFNIVILGGMIFRKLFTNPYVSLVLILLLYVFLSISTYKVFINKFGSDNLVSRKRGFIAVAFIFNLLLLTYLVLLRQYIIAVVIVLFYTAYYLALKHFQNKISIASTDRVTSEESLKYGLGITM